MSDAVFASVAAFVAAAASAARPAFSVASAALATASSVNRSRTEIDAVEAPIGVARPVTADATVAYAVTTTEPEAGSVTDCSLVPRVATAESVVRTVEVAAPFDETRVLIVAPLFRLPNTSYPATLSVATVPAAPAEGAVKEIEFKAPAVPCT